MRITALLVALLATGKPLLAETESVTMETRDGVTVYGEVYTSPGTPKSAPLVLRFHQGASNARAEYEPLADRARVPGGESPAMTLGPGPVLGDTPVTT